MIGVGLAERVHVEVGPAGGREGGLAHIEAAVPWASAVVVVGVVRVDSGD